MGGSQLSPGFRNANILSTTHHPDSDSVHRMLQQHLSEATASTPYRSTLHNIQESETDELSDQQQQQQNASTNPTSYPPPNEPAMMNTCGNPMTTSFTGVRHREGPTNASHDKSLFHSLYGQTGAYEPNSSDIITADMCLSTLFLHELYHRQSRRRGVRLQTSQQQQQQQQNIWQTPHQQPNTDVSTGPSPLIPVSQPTTPSRQVSAAEKTPLLYPKKT